MPVSRMPLLLLVFGFAVTQTVQAQPAKKPVDDKFRTYRLEAKQTGEQSNKVNQMKNGSVNLDPPSAEDKAALLEVARNYVYPVTHQEYYFTPDGPELVARTGESRSPATILRNFRASFYCRFRPHRLPPNWRTSASSVRQRWWRSTRCWLRTRRR